MKLTSVYNSTQPDAYVSIRRPPSRLHKNALKIK